MQLKKRLVVAGTLSVDPFAGMAWMHMQFAAGLLRLGHDVYYIEMSGNWPYDPVRQSHVDDSNYALPYLESVATAFGMGERWAYRRGYSDGLWFGPAASRGVELLATADAVFNVTGTSRFAEQGLRTRRLVYHGTDPVHPELQYAAGDPLMRQIIDEHDDVVTYGENIGTPGCAIPPLPRLRAHTRQPVLMDLWNGPSSTRDVFTTVGNWAQSGRDVTWEGETYLWSKHHEWLRFLDVPARADVAVELATNLLEPSEIRHGPNEIVRAGGLAGGARAMLIENGFSLASGPEISLDPWRYRDYIRSSRGEFTVARDLNVRLRSGWFSERSACYLAAGRPVVTQNTGFARTLPTGEGLFAFDTTEECVAAFESINADYERHSRAARGIAEEYFRAETVLQKLLVDLGV
jgi:hypothetical protein